MVNKSKKITLTVFLAMIITLCLCSLNASAANEGYYIYEIKDGEVTITGCDRSISGDVVIPEKLGGIRVTAIGEKAFYGCSEITTVTIDDNIKSIGKGAFAHCYALSEVILPDCIQEIADETFDMCFNLAKVSLTKTEIRRIGSRAFAYCEFLESVTFPDTLESVGTEAFKECGNLQSVIIGTGTKNIETDAFAKCYNLFNVYYMGTEDVFKAITIGEGNDRLKVAAVYYEHIHVYDNKALVSEGDCVIKGRSIYTCRCSDSYNEFKYGEHTYKSVTTKATFKANGKTESKCKLCGNVKKTTVIPKVVAKLSSEDFAYTGKAVTPAVSVRNSKGTALTKDKSYTLKYSGGRTAMGRYSVTVKLSGSKYSGSTKLYFNIVPGTPDVKVTSDNDSIKLTWNKITGAKGYKVYSYNPATKKYKALKTLSSTSYEITGLTSSTEYSYSVRAYAKVDGETVWGNHGLVNTATTPDTVKLTSVKAKDSSRAVLKWSKVSSDGYEIYMAEGKNAKYKKVKTVTKSETVTYTKSSLKSGKTYYFYVRAYKTVGDVKIYGASSNVKSVSIK